MAKGGRKKTIVLTQSQKFRRVALAVMSLAMFATGGALTLFPSLGVGAQSFLANVLLKVGFVLGIAWLAAPQLDKIGWEKLRGTALLALVFLIILYAIRPRLAAIAGALLAASGLVFSIAGWIRKLKS